MLLGNAAKKWKYKSNIYKIIQILKIFPLLERQHNTQPQLITSTIRRSCWLDTIKYLSLSDKLLFLVFVQHLPIKGLLSLLLLYRILPTLPFCWTCCWKEAPQSSPPPRSPMDYYYYSTRFTFPAILKLHMYAMAGWRFLYTSTCAPPCYRTHYYSRFMAPNPIKWITSTPIHRASKVWTTESPIRIIFKSHCEYKRIEFHYQYQHIHTLCGIKVQRHLIPYQSTTICSLSWYPIIPQQWRRPWPLPFCWCLPNYLKECTEKGAHADGDGSHAKFKAHRRPQETPPYSLENI